MRASVILRGDAVPLTVAEVTQMNKNRTITPLSNLGVRAYFDPPRIFLGKRKKSGYSYLPLQIGPVSNVVLDTTFYDNRFRIGMGGTSGTRFVFARTNDKEATEYKELLNMTQANKIRVIGRLCLMMTLSLCLASGGAGLSNLWEKIVMPSAKRSLTSNKTLIWLLWNGLRVLAAITSFITGLLVLLISFSSGGIGRDEMLPAE